MEVIISGIKNIVIIVVFSEFLKNFLIDDKFKKYITVCVNILVIGFVVSQIKSVPISWELEIPDFTSDNYQNEIEKEYEKRVASEIKKKLSDNKILVYDVIVNANSDYTIEKISVTVRGNKKATEEILEGLKIENYEIIISNE